VTRRWALGDAAEHSPPDRGQRVAGVGGTVPGRST
jgi:hypothetical protein